jgi:hypothetical protein
MSETVAIVGQPRRQLPYPPVDERWAAGAGKSGPEIEHAVTDPRIDRKATLCGLEGAPVDVYRHFWRPTSSKACPECVEAAYEVDARWPPDRRHHA